VPSRYKHQRCDRPLLTTYSQINHQFVKVGAFCPECGDTLVIAEYEHGLLPGYMKERFEGMRVSTYVSPSKALRLREQLKSEFMSKATDDSSRNFIDEEEIGLVEKACRERTLVM